MARDDSSTRDHAASDEARRPERGASSAAHASSPATPRALTSPDPAAPALDAPSEGEPLGFFSHRPLRADELRAVLADGPREERLRALSQLLRHAPYREIWRYTDRETVRASLDELDLPPSLRAAWARHLDRHV